MQKFLNTFKNKYILNIRLKNLYFCRTGHTHLIKSIK